ncbi:arginine N-succinyltransferase [Pandoraea fibrosis]|uniref:Arginine N-succinyltransferase n=1 Tax=Pandoraea fibrosis TaxID=1891094 RepID=A0A5E4RRC2_9BURK|nr:arginine N-succinyltransferase [Pandoraea fibrosis]QHF13707.1 arginine N-succinyltransferase [Pandoraea fibrosis]VVD65970.1 arginine N-succinyltransferase [Pandoraea fibrosis]
MTRQSKMVTSPQASTPVRSSASTELPADGATTSLRVVRLARPGDLPALLKLAALAGPGMTSFKPDQAALEARLARVAATVQGHAPTGEQGYLFVMEDVQTGEIAGVCGLEAAVGLEQPFYTYRKDTIVHASRELNVWSRMLTLSLSNDLTGYSELCSLLLDPSWRGAGNGALLSKARFLFMAQFPERFGPHVCAELRGYFDDEGQSPFWQSLGQHFFKIDFDQADYLTSIGKKSFVAELMPKYPIYVDFLSPQAQAAIGVTHRDTLPARRLLEQEGMRSGAHVDIFDSGPVLEARVADLRAARDSRYLSVNIASASGEDSSPAPAVQSAEPYLVACLALDGFRATLVTGRPERRAFTLSPLAAQALGVKQGDRIQVLPLKPPRAEAI